MSRLGALLARVRPSAAGAPLWAAVLGVLPLPLWFLLQALAAPAPAWRAEYRPRPGGAGSAAVVFERQLGRYWDKSEPEVPGGADVHAFTASWLGCLHVEAAREAPFMLVASGAASFSIDGVEALRVPPSKRRRSVGAVLRLEPGVHALGVELEASGWPSIALQASFDDAPPVALGSGPLAAGLRLTPPGSGTPACGRAP